MSQFSQYKEGFSISGTVEPPVLAKQVPVLKDSDPHTKRPQLMPFFNSQQFKLWDEGELERYNQLMNILLKWTQLGWCSLNTESSFNKEHQNWLVWVQWASQVQVPAEEIEPLLSPSKVSPEFGA
jgi:hypothetical protein